MARQWSRKRPIERGFGYDIASWEGAAVLGLFCVMVSAPLPILLWVTRSLLLTFIGTVACAVGGAFWLVRMIRAHGDPDA